MFRLVLVGTACAALGFGAGLLVAPTIRSPAGRTGESSPSGMAVERAGADPGQRLDDRPGSADERMARLAVAAARLERAASNSPKLMAPAPTRTPWGDVIVDKEQPMTLEQLPAPLRAVVAQVAQGRPVRELTLERRSRDGQPLFEAEFKLDGAEHELKMDEQGKILESEVDFALGELPAAVTTGIAAVMPGAVLLTAEREQIRDDPAFFEIHIRHQGQRYQVQVAEDGRLLRTSPR